MEFFISWWNVENLFDTFDSPERPEWLQRSLNSELKGWDQGVLNTKLNQLTKVITTMNAGAGPDMLGVCEVENQTVLEKLLAKVKAVLPTRNYKVSHHDGSDHRGIDTAIIYDGDLFTEEMQFHRVIIKRYSTRDLFQVNYKMNHNQKPFVVIANHWPSRSAGQYESQPYRIIAAETLSYWMERISEIMGKNTPVLAMGDFNDEPFNRSLTDYAQSTSSRLKVSYSRGPRLYNPMHYFSGLGLGTHYYNNFPTILDMFLINKPLLTGAGGIKPVPGPEGRHTDTEIYRHPEMVNTGRYKSPIRFGRPKSGFDPDGFSDHYPITIRLKSS